MRVLLIILALASCKSREDRMTERVIGEAIDHVGIAPAAPGRVDDNPRDDEGRPPEPARGEATVWRPYRANVIAAGDSVLMSYERDGKQRLAVVERDREKQLLEVPASQIVRPLALDDRYAYFNHELEADASYERKAKFCRVARTGGKVETLREERAGKVVLAGERIFYSAGGGRYVDAGPSTIVARDRAGRETILRGPARETVMGMAVLDNELYITTHDQPDRPMALPPAHLLVAELDGAIAELATFPSDRPTELVTYEGALYYATEGVPMNDDGTIRKWNAPAKLGDTLVSGLAIPDHLSAGNGHLCWALMRRLDRREVLCLRLATGKLVTMKSSKTDIPYHPVIAGGRVLWTEEIDEQDRTVAMPLEE